MLAWLRLAAALIKAGAKYGARFAAWVWSRKSQILKWSSSGYTVAEMSMAKLRSPLVAKWKSPTRAVVQLVGGAPPALDLASRIR